MKARLRIRLKECLELHTTRTGEHLTYRELAARAGLSYDTVKAIASRPSYNASLRAVEKLCGALDVGPWELLDAKRQK